MNEFDCCSKFQSEKACEENVENLDMTSEILKIVKIIQRYILKDFFMKIRTTLGCQIDEYTRLFGTKET